jgi:predicted Zn-dependent protease with MMP-like domain
MTPISDEECEEAVREALDSLPPEIAARLANVAVIIDDSPTNGLMGVYDPRGGLRRIVIFRSANPSAKEVRRTVLHEVGHHFGMSEQQIRELGYG